MHDIKSLAQILGMTEREVRYRLTLLDGVLSNHVKQGKNRKILVDQGGVALLQRVKHFEEQGMPVLVAAEKVKTELASRASPAEVKPTETSETSALIEALKEQIRRLEEDKRFLQNRVKLLEELLYSKLPGAVDPNWQTDIEYLRRTIEAQREELAELRRALEARKPWWQRLFHRPTPNRN